MSKARGFISFLLLMLAMVAAAAAIAVCGYAMKAEPVILGDSGDPGQRAQEFLEKALGGDAEGAEDMLYAQSALGLSGQPEDAVGQLLYSALLDSFSIEPCGEVSVSGTNASAEFTVTYLDIPAITAQQQPLTEARLARLLEEAARAEDVLNEDGSYREDVAMSVLEQVTAELLESAENSYVQTRLSINLVYSGDQWMIVADNALFRVLCGNTAY